MNREKVIELAREAGFWNGLGIDGLDELEKFAALVAAAEREACAKLCEELGEADRGDYPIPTWQWGDCAAAIRGRA